MSDTPLLRLDEVSRIYGEEVKVHALDGVSLALIVVGVAVFRHGASVREAQFGGQQQRTAQMRVCCWPIR